MLALFTLGGLAGLTLGQVPGQNGIPNQNLGSPNSVQCQNARDAAIAGSATAHQLLTNALQVVPLGDNTTLDGIQKAQAALSSIGNSTAALVISLALQASPKPSDLQVVNQGSQNALLALGIVQQNAAQAEAAVRAQNNNTANVNAGLVTSQIAVITANGPQVQQLAATGGQASSALVGQATLQLQSVQQAVQFSASCVGATLNATNGPVPAVASPPSAGNANVPVTSSAAPAPPQQAPQQPPQQPQQQAPPPAVQQNRVLPSRLGFGKFWPHPV